MTCKRCHKKMTPAERASYRVLCEDCWCGTNWVAKSAPRQAPRRLREAERREAPVSKD
jgi:hypothetical protein